MNRNERILTWSVLAFWIGYIGFQVVTHERLSLQLVIVTFIVGMGAGNLQSYHRARARFLKAHREQRMTVIDDDVIRIEPPP